MSDFGALNLALPLLLKVANPLASDRLCLLESKLGGPAALGEAPDAALRGADQPFP